MKKIAIGIVLILAIAAGSMPFVNGIVMEKGFKKCLNELNGMYAESGTKMSATLERYERGFMNTEIEWKIDLGEFKSFYGVDEIVLLERAEHGFTGVTSHTSLEKNDWYLKFVEERLGGEEPVSLVTTYLINGGIDSTIDISKFSFEVEGKKVDVKPGTMNLKTTMQLESFQFSGDWSGMSLADAAAVNDIVFSSDVSKISTYIWEGTSAFKVGSITAQEQGESVAINDLNVEYTIDYDQAKKALAVEALYGISEITDGSEKVEGISVTLGAGGVDAAAYEEAMKVYIELAGMLFTDISAAGDDAELLAKILQEKMMNYGLQLMAVYEKFLKQGLEVYVRDFTASMPQGEVQGGVTFTMKKDLTMAQMMPMMNDPEMIFEYLDYKSDFVMPTVLATNKAQLVTPILPGMSKGIFVEEGEKLVHHAETRDQKLFLNGEQVSLR